MRRELVAASLVAAACSASRPAVPPPTAAPAAPACSLPEAGPAPLRRLTRDQYINSVGELLGLDQQTNELRGSSVVAGTTLPADEHVGPFRSNVVAAPTDLDVQQLMEAAERIAERAAREHERLLACSGNTAIEQSACARAFVARFGRRAFRRPLAPDELDRYTALFTAADGPRDGVQAVVRALLQSPYFLVHTREDGPPAGRGLVALGPYALASRLSYLLWVSGPDDLLLDAAARGELDRPEGLRRQAERMLADDRARRGLVAFHLQWLGVEDVASLSKNGKLFPEWKGGVGGAALGHALRRETERFVDAVIRRGDGRYATLMTAPFSFLEEALYPYYGVMRSEAARDDQPVMLDGKQRAGLLTQGSVLAYHAHAAQSSPVARGVMIRKNLLCHDLPDPPPNVNNTPPDPDPTMTTRERFEDHRLSGVCSGCHKLIDPLGFPLEHYDAIGRWRETENGKPIDATGSFHDAGDLRGDFDGALELAAALAGSRTARACYVRQWFRFALGRHETPDDACTIERLEEAFERAGGDVRVLLVELPATDSFRLRQMGRDAPAVATR